jgi:hypothetical protein
VTNRPISQQDNDTFLRENAAAGVGIISPLNLENYLSPSLAGYMVY